MNIYFNGIFNNLNLQLKKQIWIVIGLITSHTIHAQNLVPNNGFDMYSSCPDAFGQVDLASPWNTVTYLTRSPDYMNACSTDSMLMTPGNFFGYQVPISGDGYMGIATYLNSLEFREYITVPLSSPLVSGVTYRVGFYVSLADDINFATDHIGAYLSAGPALGSGTAALPFIPQIDNPSGNIIFDADNWTLISGTYTATGGENYITIGNFHNDANTQISMVNNYMNTFGYERNIGYYFIEDVLIPYTPLEVTGDTILCNGDTDTLFATGSISYAWATSSNPTAIIDNDSVLIVSPSSTTTYLVYGDDNDTVSYTVHIINLNPVDLGNDTTLCPGNTLLLNAAGNNHVSYLWQDNSIDSVFNVSTTGSYWVEISSHHCSIYDTIQIDYFPLLSVNLGNDTTICSGQNILLNAATNPIAIGSAYVWNTGSTDPHLIVNQPGIYSVTVINACTTSVDSIQLEVQFPPQVYLGNDTTLCLENNLLLDATHSNTIYYLWNNNSTSSTFHVEAPGTYWVKVENMCGSATDTIRVDYIDCTCSVYIPNNFTPDGNKLNEVFFPQINCHVTSYQIDIYNRWGEIIFSSVHIGNGWDGTYKGNICPPGVYTYSITYQFENTFEVTKRGQVNLIR